MGVKGKQFVLLIRHPRCYSRRVGQHNAQRNTNNIIKTSALLQTIGVKTNRTSFLCGKIQ